MTIKILGLICPNLSITALDPKSDEHDDQMAPILATDKNEITVSGILGRTAATLSPFFYPYFQ